MMQVQQLQTSSAARPSGSCHGSRCRRRASLRPTTPPITPPRSDLQPEDIETGWMPIRTPWGGNAWGMFCPPTPGEEVEIGFQEGGKQAGYVKLRAFGDKFRPLPVPSGEFWLVHKSGSFLKFHNDGSVEVNAHGDLNATVGGQANLTVAGKVVAGAGIRPDGQRESDRRHLRHRGYHRPRWHERHRGPYPRGLRHSHARRNLRGRLQYQRTESDFMTELAHYFGSDLTLSASGDLLTADGLDESKQRSPSQAAHQPAGLPLAAALWGWAAFLHRAAARPGRDFRPDQEPDVSRSRRVARPGAADRPPADTERDFGPNHVHQRGERRARAA